MSLSQLTGQEIRVSFPESRLVPIRDVAELMGGEERVVGGMYVGVQGDLDGGHAAGLPEKNLLALDDLLHGRAVGTATQGRRGRPLGALGDGKHPRLAASSTPIADATHLPSYAEVPEISIDMCLPVIDSVLARFNQPGDKLLLTEAVIYGERARKRGVPPAAVPGAGFPAAAHGGPGGRADGARRRRRHAAAGGVLTWTADTVTVKMAEMDVVTDGRSLKTILGSCVGIILRDPERGVSGLAHVMLPARHRDDDATGKYADTAIPALLARLAKAGAAPAPCRRS